MADHEQEAAQLIAKAEKKLTKMNGCFGYLFRLFGGSSRIDKAIECYQRAGYVYKMSRNWYQAGSAFHEAAALHQKALAKLPRNSRREHAFFLQNAATNYTDAGNCYKKFKLSNNKAVHCFNNAIKIYTEMGRFHSVAQLHQTIAEMYENQLDHLDHAVRHYEKAADFFELEECESSANSCWLKVANYASQLGEYQKAIRVYEQLASASLENRLLNVAIKENLFHAALCHLCVDTTNASLALDRYEEMCPLFRESSECELVKTLIDHVEEHDVNGFAKTVKEYDYTSSEQQWFTIILRRIGNLMNEDLQ